MSKQRIGRAKVLSHPACIFVAEEECQIVLFAVGTRVDGDGTVTNPAIIIAVDEVPAIPYGDENAAILPPDKGFPVYLAEGQRLYAVSTGESEVTFSVLPSFVGAAGY